MSCAPKSGATANAASHLARLPHPLACTETKDVDERLVIDWPAHERAKLESAARKGLVFVRVAGCAVRVVEMCASQGRYDYAPTSRQREVTSMRDADEISTRLPFGAARFAAGVGTSAALDVTMTVVGRYEAASVPLSARELQGDCHDVTHVVASLSVGSFDISASSDARLTGTADVVVAGAHATSGAARRHLDSAGIEARCANGRRTDTSPPDDCGIPLRLELRGIGARAATAKVGPQRSATSAPVDRKDMKRASEVARIEVAPCYRRALANDAKLAGTLTLMVSVGPEGNVKSVSTKHDVPDGLAECAVRRIERVTFPRVEHERPRVFVVPFVFNGAS